jgi:hypothetical protein
VRIWHGCQAQVLGSNIVTKPSYLGLAWLLGPDAWVWHNTQVTQACHLGSTCFPNLGNVSLAWLPDLKHLDLVVSQVHNNMGLTCLLNQKHLDLASYQVLNIKTFTNLILNCHYNNHLYCLRIGPQQHADHLSS